MWYEYIDLQHTLQFDDYKWCNQRIKKKFTEYTFFSHITVIENKFVQSQNLMQVMPHITKWTVSRLKICLNHIYVDSIMHSLSKINLNELRILDMGFTDIRSIEIFARSNFPNLTELNLNRTNISNLSCIKKSNFMKLKKLKIYQIPKYDIDWLPLYPNKQLQTYQGQHFSDKAQFEDIRMFVKTQLTNLKKIHLSSRERIKQALVKNKLRNKYGNIIVYTNYD